MARGVGGVGPANIMKHMKGIHFPASKEDILATAKKGPGPDTDKVLGILQQIPDQTYNTLPDILKAVGKIE
jgi:hypothetical protein